MNKVILGLCGPSGAGKTTLRKVLAGYGAREVVTCTTRQPEKGEVNGVDYYFITPEKFRAWMNLGRFAEYAQFAGHYYGTLKKELAEDFGEPFKVLVAEPFGMAQLKGWAERHGLPMRVVWFDIPEEARMAKMVERGRTAESAEARMAKDDIVERWAMSGLVADYVVDRYVDPGLLGRDILRAFGIDAAASAAAVA